MSNSYGIHIVIDQVPILWFFFTGLQKFYLWLSHLEKKEKYWKNQLKSGDAHACKRIWVRYLVSCKSLFFVHAYWDFLSCCWVKCFTFFVCWSTETFCCNLSWDFILNFGFTGCSKWYEQGTITKKCPLRSLVVSSSVFACAFPLCLLVSI